MTTDNDDPGWSGYLGVLLLLGMVVFYCLLVRSCDMRETLRIQKIEKRIGIDPPEFPRFWPNAERDEAWKKRELDNVVPLKDTKKQ